jgi:hypothetical protein
MKYEDNEETTHLEASGTPINKLDRTLRFDTRNCCRRVLGHNVAAVKQTHGHCHEIRSWMYFQVGLARTVLSILWVTFYLFTPHSAKGTKRHWKKVYHLIAILEAGKSHLCHSVLLV